MKTLDQRLKDLSVTSAREWKGRAEQLISVEMSLRDLRRALKKTQQTVAASLNMGEDGISRLEQRSDLILFRCRRWMAFNVACRMLLPLSRACSWRRKRILSTPKPDELGILQIRDETVLGRTNRLALFMPLPDYLPVATETGEKS